MNLSIYPPESYDPKATTFFREVLVMMLGIEAQETGEYDHLPLKYKWAKNKFFSCLKVLSLFFGVVLRIDISYTLLKNLTDNIWYFDNNFLSLFSCFLLSHCSKRLLSDFCENVNFINFGSFERRWSTTENSIRCRNKFENIVKEFLFIKSQQDCPKT